ncbi:hypothetical protein GGR56DRAFT_696123 [Xylariaceae sp. FL0804]|nr:hypothetical protein GGR56DRAFT_696123 [Xylariaceae sp. FL0804]
MATSAPKALCAAAPSSIARLSRAGPRMAAATLRTTAAPPRIRGAASFSASSRPRVPEQTPPSTKYPNLKADITPVTRAPRKGILPEFGMEGKVIVVSGGAQGLGLVQVEALLEAGATVHVFDRQPEPAPGSNYQNVARRAREELSPGGSTAPLLHYHQIDVRAGVDELNRASSEIAGRHGRLDGLIAAAGVQQETPALDYTAADSDRMLGINVTGVLMTAQAVARQMVRLEQPGSIVLIASMSASIANRGLICPVYNASKAAVVQLARNLAMEWGARGIRVNTISPGYIVTEMVERLFALHPDREREWPRQNMLGRLSRPDDYRGAAVFLLSDASRFMTGADLRIDGGHSAW